MHAAGHQIIARALGRGARHERRLDLEKALLGKIMADGQRNLVAQLEVVLHLGRGAGRDSDTSAALFIGDARRPPGENGGGFDSFSSSSSCATTSISPVGMLRIDRRLRSRRRTLPLTATTYSDRSRSALAWPSPECSLSSTTCVMPVRSRTSRKMRLPWSRRRLTQPINTTCCPACPRAALRTCACDEVRLKNQAAKK